MKLSKRFLPLIICLIFTAAFVPHVGAATSGSCGSNVSWTLDTVGGVLTISGSGSMNDYINSFNPWSSNRLVKSVVIEDGITHIGASAFSGCTALSFVTISDSVTSIGASAFSACSSLTEITIPENVTAIEDYTFNGCSSITSIIIPDKVKSIGRGAFSYCSSLASVSIPKSVITFMPDVFSYCPLLTSAGETGSGCDIEFAWTTIPNNAFYGCTSLQSIDFPSYITSIGYSAFYNCTSLSSITIPDSVISIGDSAFCYCSSLSEVNMSGNMNGFGESAFFECSSLKEITVPDGITSILTYTFYNCKSLTSINLPRTITSIADSAFSSCRSLTDVFYGGSRSEWAGITISDNNAYLTDATIHYAVRETAIISLSAEKSADGVAVLAEIDNPDNGTVFAAGYSNNAALAAVTVQNGTAILPAETETVKIFIWGKNSLLPLCQSASAVVK
ncbi:MAG: leucine-rich repeat domain-containing protein [Clostridia bacterium]|nr:leucine-rich repeat domain-containing protein [Clostridia bacterium]